MSRSVSRVAGETSNSTTPPSGERAGSSTEGLALPVAGGDARSPVAEGDVRFPVAEGDVRFPVAEGDVRFPVAEGDVRFIGVGIAATVTGAGGCRLASDFSSAENVPQPLSTTA